MMQPAKSEWGKLKDKQPNFLNKYIAKGKRESEKEETYTKRDLKMYKPIMTLGHD